MANYKAEATAQQIADELAVRLSTTASVDLSGTDPVVTITSAAAGGGGFLVKVLDQRAGVDAGFKALPGFGSVTQPVYTGTVFQIAFELGAGSEIVATFDKLLPLTGDLCRRGARVEWYSVANAAPLAFTTAQGVFDPNMYYPLSGRV